MGIILVCWPTAPDIKYMYCKVKSWPPKGCTLFLSFSSRSHARIQSPRNMEGCGGPLSESNWTVQIFRPWPPVLDLNISDFAYVIFFLHFFHQTPPYLSFSGNRNGGVIQYDTRCPNLGGRRLGQGQDVCGMAMSHNSHHVVTGGNGGLVRLWDLRTHQCFRTIKAHSACAKVWFGSFTL